MKTTLIENDALFQAAVTAWAARGLPARLDAVGTAKQLAVAPHDVPLLVRIGLLRPLGDPKPNAVKWFSAIEVIQRSLDHSWLNRASREISRYWLAKRQRCAQATGRGGSGSRSGGGERQHQANAERKAFTEHQDKQD